jgi:hypothetical protein
MSNFSVRVPPAACLPVRQSMVAAGDPLLRSSLPSDLRSGLVQQRTADT